MRRTWTHKLLAAALLGAGTLPAYGAPSAPTLAFPENLRVTSDKTPSLDWTDVSGATYTVQVSAVDDFSSLAVSSAEIISSSYTLTALEALTRGTTYYWRVRSGDSTGESVFSSTRSFTVSLNRITYAVEIDSTTPLASPLTFSTSVVSGDRVTPTSNQYALGPFALTPQTTHYWRVKASDDGGNESAFTPEFKFNTYPKVLTLVPTDGATLNAPTPLFDWTDAAWAASYTLEVSLYADFSTLKISSAGLPSSQYQSTITDALTNNTTFYWRARAVNGSNVSVSTAAAFFLDLERPVLSSPPNQANVRTRVPLLDWTSVAWAGAYNLQVSNQSDFSVLKISSSGISSSQYPVSLADALSDKTTYYWHVQAASATVTSAYTSTSSFYLEIVSTATLIFPENLRVTSDKTPSFQWDLPSSTHDVTFTLEWAENPAMSPLLSSQAGITTGAYTLSGALTRGTTYYWRVKTLVNDYNGASTLTSSTRSFTVSLNRITYAVELDSTTPLAAPLTFSTSVVSADRVTPTPNQYTLTASQALDKGSTYYWRLRADDDGGNASAFSSTYSFVLPGITRPTFSAGGSSNFTLNWASTFPPGTTTYYAEISTTSNFSPVSATLATTNFFAAFTGLTSGSTYYARVSTDAATGPYSNTGSTRTLPAAPLLLYPGNNRGTSDLTPTVRWSTAGDTSVRYTLQWANNPGMSPLLFSKTDISTDNYTLDGVFPQLLARGTAYYWRIQALDTVSGATTLSAVNALSVILNRIAYNLEVSSESAMTPLQVSTQVLSTDLLLPTTNVYTVTAAESLSMGTTYHWQVRAQDMGGNASVFASSQSFFVDLYLPTVATPTFSAVTNAGLTVNWTSGTQAGYNPAGVNYKVRLSTAENFSPILQSIETTNLTAAFTGLTSATTYYAQVAAFEGASTTAYTNLGSTRTLPSVATLLYPISNRFTSDLTPTVRWSTAGDTSVKYTLQWANNSGMSPLLFSQPDISTDNYTLSGSGDQVLARGAAYYWRIQALDTVSGATTLSATNALSVILNRIAYNLEVSSESALAPLHVSSQVLSADLLLPTTNVYAVPSAESLSLGTTYHWRVRAQDMGGNASVFASSQSFILPCNPATSLASGLWSNAATWSTGIVPESCTAVTIAAGHTVTLDVMNAVSSNTVINGTLKASRLVSSSWTLVQGDLNVNAGGTLDYGTEADPIPATIKAHLVLALGSSAGQYGLIVSNGGNFTARGATKTPYAYATQSITTSDTSLTVYGSTSTVGWQVGDTITIGPTSGSGVATTSSRTITSLSAGPLYTIAWSEAALPQARLLTATSPIIVANLTHNVLVRSSDAANSAYIRNLAQNSTSFALAHGEFAYLGANLTSKYGITFDGVGTQGSISSSSIRNGYRGVALDGSSTNTLTANTLCFNSNYGIFLNNSSNNIVTSNSSYSNNRGVHLAGSVKNTLINNNFYSNSNVGIGLLTASNNNTLTSNNSYSNSTLGIFSNSNNNTLTSNNFYSNGSNGINITGSGQTLRSNNFYSNLNGIYLSNSSNNTLTTNNFYSNSNQGIIISGGSNNTLTANNSYSNLNYGIYLDNSSTVALIDGNMGYNSAGASLPNATAEISFFTANAVAEKLILKGSRINLVAGVDAAGINAGGVFLGDYILSYNQDQTTGTVRLWGNYQLSGSTLTLDHALPLYASTNTIPKLMRGSGHAITNVATFDADTLSELITVTAVGGGNWKIEGSSSGVLQAAFNCPSGSCAFTHAKLGFTLTPGGTIETGDLLDFTTSAASKDANFQKSLLFGPCPACLGDGRSKIEIDATGGIVLKGKSDGTANTLIDMFATGSTYYTFVDSGAFTAAFSSFTNADPGGIQLSGSAGVSLSSSTFDFLGFASGTNTYITARDLTSNATFYNVTFGLSRSSAGYDSAYNVRVEGAETGLAVALRGPAASLGPLWGEASDSELGASNKVNWTDTFSCDPIASAQSGPWSSPFTWDLGFVPTSCNSLTITSGHVVTLDAMNAASANTVINGTLKASRLVSSSWTLTAGNLNVNSGGTLDYGSEADPLPAAVNAHLVLALGSTAGQYGLIVNNGGNFTVRGATKTPYAYATQSITTADTSLTVYGSTSTDGWQVGDMITIGPTSGNGTATTASRVIASITPAGSLYTIAWSGGILPQARILAATTPIVVANLTRNTLIRSSGTASNGAYIQNLAQNATSFALAHGEFAYLGADLTSKHGITLDGALTRGSISSSTIRNGYRGIYFNASSNNTLAGNNIYFNSSQGIVLSASSNNTLIGNHSCANSSYGIQLESSLNNTLTGNNSCSNSNKGIFLSNSSNNTLVGNNSYSNSNEGIPLFSSSKNILTRNNSYSNSFIGIVLEAASNNNALIENIIHSNAHTGIHLQDSSNNTFIGNNVYSNAVNGITLIGSPNNTLIGNNFYSNSSPGIRLENSANNNILIKNNSYSNLSYGIRLQNSSNNSFASGSLGYDGSGASRPNTTAEIYFEPTTAETLVLKDTRVNPAVGVSLAGLNTAGNHILSYNQDYATGTVRLWGNYQLSGSTLTLDYALQLYASTNTTPKLMRGTGHSITAVVTKDPDTLSELITVTALGGGNWKVEGSSSGVLNASFNCPSGSCAFTHAKMNFTLNVGGTLNAGDALDFVTTAASGDASRQKSLLFGPAASTFNQGRSKLEVASSGGLVLRGKSDGTANTLIDMFATGSTYYTLVDSGAFTAAFSSFTNADPGGIQLSGSAGVSISSSTFDFLGFASGTNTYVTARDLTSSATFYNVTFGLSRSSAGFQSAYNVRLEGSDANLRWTFTNPVGPLRGEAYDSDLNNYVIWGRRRLKVVLIR